MNIHFGADYYPEHWPEERWPVDAELMQEMGIQVVRMAEFSWHKLEPEEGKYDFAWLDKVVALLGGHGIRTILGTPSAAPPAWMIRKHPDILPTDHDGRVRGFGGRHHDCQSNPVYRDYIRKIVTAMAEHYADNPYVIGWQPDNELGNSHDDLCHCRYCRENFQNWLRRKYGTVNELNKAWGAAFWSQEYNSFEEVFTPALTVTGENPSQLLDWKKFHSDLIVDFLKMQADILREHCPHQFITHNFMGFADTVDYYDLAKQLDFVSHDQYPGGFFGPQPHDKNASLAATLDVVRSYKNQSYWIMEQQSGITGWQVMGRAPQPGQLTAWTLQSIAHGADAVVYFRWRVCALGTEQYWHGILPHSGVPGRRYAELKETVHSMAPLMDAMQGAVPAAETAIVFSFAQLYAFRIQPQNPELSYVGQILKYYEALYERNIPVDFVPDTGDFSKYKLLIAPLQYLMTPELEERYFSYVQNGGHLVLTMRTGVKDEHNICMTDRELPGRLGSLAGIDVLDYDCLLQADVSVTYEGKKYKAEKWADMITVKNPAAATVEASQAAPTGDTCVDADGTKTAAGVTVLASYASEFYAGTPCITENLCGKGMCWYVGTEPSEELLADLTGRFVSRSGVHSLGKSDPEVELTAKENGNGRWIFAINHAAETRHFEVPAGFHMIRGKTAGTLEGFETQIFENQSVTG
jgi:beta-galactosidase